MVESYNVMLCSPSSVKGIGYIIDNVSDDGIGVAIREVQQDYLSEITGERLIEKLQDLILAKKQGDPDNIDATENAHYKVLLDRYIIPYLAWKAQVLLTIPQSYKLRNMGVVQNSDQNVNRATSKEIYLLRSRLESGACRKATKLSKYLCQNKDLFPELDECPCDRKPMLGKDFVNCALGLDNPNGNTCC